MCPVTQGPYCAFLSPFLLSLSCVTFFVLHDYSVLCLEQQQTVLIELSSDDVLTFDVEGISDSMQSSIAMSCSSSTTEDSLVVFEVTSNPPLQYSISPSTGFLLMNKASGISVELLNSELGLVHFLSTVPGIKARSH